MFDAFLCAIGTVLAVIGFVCVVSLLLLRSVRPKKDERFYITLVFGADEVNACLRVSYLLSQLSCTGDLRSCRILAVDRGMEPLRAAHLREAFSRDPHVVVCTPEEANRILFEKRPQNDARSPVEGTDIDV